VPLGDVDPNIRRRLRSGSTTTEAALSQPAKRPRGRPHILSTRIESLEPEGLCPRGRPRIVDEPSVETLRIVHLQIKRYFVVHALLKQ
jgi:hypothetical protein